MAGCCLRLSFYRTPRDEQHHRHTTGPGHAGQPDARAPRRLRSLPPHQRPGAVRKRPPRDPVPGQHARDLRRLPGDPDLPLMWCAEPILRPMNPQPRLENVGNASGLRRVRVGLTPCQARRKPRFLRLTSNRYLKAKHRQASKQTSPTAISASQHGLAPHRLDRCSPDHSGARPATLEGNATH